MEYKKQASHTTYISSDFIFIALNKCKFQFYQYWYKKEIKTEQKISKEKYVTKKRASSHEPLASVRKAIEAFLLCI